MADESTKTEFKTCQDCKGQGVFYFDKPEICQNCLGKRCYLCDRNGPYKFFDECPKCWGNGIIKVDNEK